MRSFILPTTICMLLLVGLETTESQGCVTTPKVAFNAYSSTGGNYGVDESIIFPVVLLNEGCGYNESTGIFTAPVAGMYQFSVQICNAAYKYLCAAIVHENTTIAITTNYDTVSTCSSTMVPAKIETGDQVYVKSTYEESVMYSNKNRWPSFTGLLTSV
ncbi:complement C1q tumor necrosis factor-related protein 2-like [Ruditapes philippinarum]|uniref:complement C1q tumor necrosis factor-related protein 2-like n=1 Tax=Ruditapes philippinarum TaxID=129788 RepID=UPI00295C1C00|nr:complement C1q tumor necrosis factor-related protein 2-like [Ruditapes philippinarum]